MSGILSIDDSQEHDAIIGLLPLKMFVLMFLICEMMTASGRNMHRLFLEIV